MSDGAWLDRFKEFRLTSLATEHQTSVVVLFVLITLGGILAYGSIPKESQPEIEIPTVAVNTIYPGVSPSDIETLITRPLEEDLNTISNLEELRSTSVEGYSSITAEFSTDVNMDDALARVREKVDLAKPELPEEAEDPQILEFNLSEFPVMQVNLSGEYGLVRLKEIGEDLQDRLEQIPSVLRVDLRGGLTRVVKVDADLSRLKFYGLTLDDVIETVRDENVNIPGGSIEVGSRDYLVRVDGEFADPSVISELVVATRQGRPVYVRDLARVEYGFEDRDSYARLDGAPVITLDVVKRSGENIIETSEAVKAAIAGMQAEFPPSTVVKITSDQSEDIETMVSSLENNIISGLILIVAVLMFFLGVRNSAFVAISIPTSMLLSFLVMKSLGITMNMVVLFSLILALGMLVDNAIVVVENIYRYMEQGWERATAARKATGEVAVPVIAATLTTLGAFAPLLFWPGIVGEFMMYLPLTLIITLSSSLFVALVIVPTLCAMFMRVEPGSSPLVSGDETLAGAGADAPVPPPAAAGTGDASAESAGVPAGARASNEGLTRSGRWTLIGLAAALFVGVAAVNWITAVLMAATVAVLYGLHVLLLSKVADWWQEKGLPAVVDLYEGQLRWALNHRAVILGGSAAVLVGTVMLFSVFSTGVEFFPEDIPPAQAWVDVETPVGSSVEFTDGVARRIEEELGAVEGTEDAESVVSTVGGGGGMFGGPSGSNAGRVSVSFVDYRDRSYDVFGTLRRMQERVGSDVAGAEISVQQPQAGPPSGAPVNLEVVGEDPEVLKSLSDSILQVLRDAPVAAKLTGLESDMEAARPELGVTVDREKAALYGLSTRDVGMAVRGAIQGIEAAKYRTGNDEHDIVVRLAERYREDLTALEDLVVEAELGSKVPLTSVADWSVGEGYGSIRRKDMDRVATISSDVATGYNSNAVLAEVRQTLADFEGGALPPGYTMRYTGQNEDQAEAQSFLSGAFLAALGLIGFILVSQFNSVAKPVIILTSVIMSTVGVLAGLMIFQMPFVIIMTGVGIISLAGIVVNNAIVLIDYIDILRHRDGLSVREALVEGGKTRFRPVILTAVTTALGLVPLAVGLNFDFFGLYRSLAPDLYMGGEQAAWWGPMAVAVIVGISFATFLTLVLVPVMYSLVDEAVGLLRKLFFGRTRDEARAAAAEAEPAVPGRPDGAPGRAPAAPGTAKPAARGTSVPSRPPGGG